MRPKVDRRGDGGSVCENIGLDLEKKKKGFWTLAAEHMTKMNTDGIQFSNLLRLDIL